VLSGRNQGPRNKRWFGCGLEALQAAMACWQADLDFCCVFWLR
jgi:hypothetical protein